MLKAVVAVALLAVVAVAAEEPVQRLSGGESSFAVVKEDGRSYWLRNNKSYHIRSSQLLVEDGDYQIYHILLLEEHQSRSHIGIEGTKSHIRLSAWRLAETAVGEKLWVIQEEADAWEWKEKTIVFTKYGCCDAPDRSTTYDVKDGSRVDG